MTIVTRDQWIDAGLRALARGGEPALRIDRLCADLGVTKGSFHHHFAGAADFRAALLERHEADERDELDRIRAESGGEAIEAIVSLPSRTRLGRRPDLERAVRAWAFHDDGAAAVQRRLDAARLALLQELWSRVLPDAAAARIAALVPLLVAAGAEVTAVASDADLDAVFALLAAIAPAVDGGRPRPVLD